MKRLGLFLTLLLLITTACGNSNKSMLEEPGVVEGPSTKATQSAPISQDAAPAATESSVDDMLASSDLASGDPALIRGRDWKLTQVTDPAVTIIEYADFQCPGCAGFAPVLHELAAAYPDDVQVVFRYFPLTSIHPNAHKSAEAAEAAGAQGKFWEYHDLLFERQAKWSPLDAAAARDFFIGLAGELGLDVDRFTAELDNGTYADYVSSLEREAINLGLPGTPSAIVNGRPVPGEGLPRDLETWGNFINEEKAMKDLASRQYKTAPEMIINVDARYLAHVEMASGKTFTIELLPKSAPQTVNSFVFLARNGWFDNVTFHRVIPGFVAQTGDPSGTGRGGPGYYIPNEIDKSLSHNAKGVVAMANAGPNTNGSQWYITYGDVSQLDGSYTIFGKVIEGMDIVEGITPRDPQRNPNAPAGDLISTITIEEILP